MTNKAHIVGCPGLRGGPCNGCLNETVKHLKVGESIELLVPVSREPIADICLPPVNWIVADSPLIMRECPYPTRIRVGFWTEWERAKPGIMMAAYGWETGAPIGSRPGETCHSWHIVEDGVEQIVGWTSLVKHATTPAWQNLAIGIMPKYVGRGWRKEMLMHASGWAFIANGAEAVTCEVLASNPEQLARYHRDSRAGFPFQYGGEVWIPDRYSMFTREKEEETGDGD